ncbi:MAG TPA: hypothetical protein VG799_00520 [Gemmatimonadota bacterium]|jgi:hypothetical protein|nr:hypothetical protein [Gemmatimonadota bacterium]
MQRTVFLRPLLAGLLLTLGSVNPLGAQELEQSPVGSFLPRQQSAPESLQEIYRQLASAWEARDARAVTRLARGGRVYVVIQREGVNQRLAAPQLQFLLDELFDRADEVSFRFPDYSSYDPRAEAGYAVGERVYRQDSAGETFVDRIFVGARSERGRWVLTEFRLTTE